MSDSNTESQFKTAKEALKNPLDVVNHEDTEKHRIGASLPVASNEELQPVGVNTTAGASTAPARADHVHGIKAPWHTSYLTPAQTIVPGANRVISPWVNNPNANSEDWTSNPDDEFINFPRVGLYLVHVWLGFNRSGGGAFAAGTIVTHGLFLTNSLGTATYIHKNIVVGGFTQYYVNEVHFHWSDIPNTTARYFVNHNDGVNWSAFAGQFVSQFVTGIE